MADREWSEQQQAIHQWFESGEGNLVVRARAGTGKTTTILAGIERARESTILLAAFNKRIAEELQTRLSNPRASAATLHSLGYRALRRNWNNVRVDEDRRFRMARNAWATFMRVERKDTRSTPMLEEIAPDQVVTAIAKLASIGKNTRKETPGALAEQADYYNVTLENGFADEYDTTELALMAYMALGAAKRRDGTCDFDDMIWLPLVHGMVRAGFDLVVIDEAQDMNAAQLELAKGLSLGRIAVVGDDRQAIYGFRGADSNALDNLKRELHASELPLTVTYRCPRLIVAEAAKLVPDFTAHPSAPDGALTETTGAGMLNMVRPGNFVLSRTNAPLARVALTLLRNNVRARIEGRDVSKGLLSLIRRMKADTMPDFMAKLAQWEAREIAKLTATKRVSAETRIEFVQDQVATLEALSDGLADTRELEARITDLFSETAGAAVVCSTVHKAKGLEAETVYVLADTLYCNGKRTGNEEVNIHYVAVTRAQRALVMVRG